MARRSVWLMTGMVAGAASSLYAERKLRRTVEAAAARLQPDALAAEVGRTARQAAVSTGSRFRDAVASGREEKRRRELELWAEVHPGGAPTDPDGASSSHRFPSGYDHPGAAAPEGSDGPSSAGDDHIRVRRARRAARRSSLHLGN